MSWFCSKYLRCIFIFYILFQQKLNGYVILQLLGHKGLSNGTDQKSLT